MLYLFTETTNETNYEMEKECCFRRFLKISMINSFSWNAAKNSKFWFLPAEKLMEKSQNINSGI